MIGHELRKAERVRLHLDTVWCVGLETRKGVIRNISMSGCFISSVDPVNLRDFVEVDVNAPSILRMTVTGAVVHRINGRGFAIRFGELNVTEQRLLKLLLKMMKERESTTVVSSVS